MKILIISPTLDLKHKLGGTPAFWQLYKAMFEIGVDVIIIPYLGKNIDSLWWRTYKNPCISESLLYEKLSNLSIFKAQNKHTYKNDRWVVRSANAFILPKWKKHIMNILEMEKDVDAIIFIGVPLNQIKGLPTYIRKQYDIPIIFWDGDMPTILPGYVEKRGFKFNYYLNADLAEYDAFISNSKGIIPKLEEMGARNVNAIYYGVDPDLYAPVNVEQDIDIFYYGHGSQAREKGMNFMITQPSKNLKDANFVVGGTDFGIDLGLAKLHGFIPFSEWRYFCCRSKINLNITRDSHAKVYASSTSRPFELAAFGCCVVSDPYNGLEEWFEIGKELFMVNNEDEAIEMYKWLLGDKEEREKVGRKARERVLKEHTFRHRAEELINIIKKVGR